MPWCFECDRYLTPNSVHTDGTCPSCGRPIEPTESGITTATGADVEGGPKLAAQAEPVAADDEKVRAPWHFWVMIVGVVVYLGWRLLQGISWGVHHWF